MVDPLPDSPISRVKTAVKSAKSRGAETIPITRKAGRPVTRHHAASKRSQRDVKSALTGGKITAELSDETNGNT
jgi:hypothetical protein